MVLPTSFGTSCPISQSLTVTNGWQRGDLGLNFSSPAWWFSDMLTVCSSEQQYVHVLGLHAGSCVPEKTEGPAWRLEFVEIGTNTANATLQFNETRIQATIKILQPSCSMMRRRVEWQNVYEMLSSFSQLWFRVNISCRKVFGRLAENSYWILVMEDVKKDLSACCEPIRTQMCQRFAGLDISVELIAHILTDTAEFLVVRDIDEHTIQRPRVSWDNTL